MKFLHTFITYVVFIVAVFAIMALCALGISLAFPVTYTQVMTFPFFAVFGGVVSIYGAGCIAEEYYNEFVKA